MSAATCTGEPISWLTLERLALGELPAARVTAVETHLTLCPACRTCLDAIRADSLALPALPPLPARPTPWWRRRGSGFAIGLGGLGGLATAAAVLVLVLRGRGDGVGSPTLAVGRTISKGGDLVVELVRERDGVTTLAPASFRAGDRFKLVVTCAPDAGFHATLLVAQAERAGARPVASFPLPAQTLACGNRVAFPGAFQLTGDQPATICLILGAETLPSRADLAVASPAAACVTIAPE